jgi:hypothetical protein
MPVAVMPREALMGANAALAGRRKRGRAAIKRETASFQMLRPEARLRDRPFIPKLEITCQTSAD